MIKVYYMEMAPFEQEDIFQAYLPELETNRKEMILRTRSRKARVRSLAAGSLLREALCAELGLDAREALPFVLQYGEYGKPCLKEHSEICFNLSHSGNYVLCGIGEEPLGVDIQEHVRIRDGIAERFFTEEEKRMLAEMTGEEYKKLFFRLWCIKESFLKYTGKGLGRGLDSFEILWEEKRVRWKEETDQEACFEVFEDLNGYSAALCTETEPYALKAPFFTERSAALWKKAAPDAAKGRIRL